MMGNFTSNVPANWEKKQSSHSQVPQKGTLVAFGIQTTETATKCKPSRKSTSHETGGPTQRGDPVQLTVGDLATQPVSAGRQQPILGGQVADGRVRADCGARTQHRPEHVRQLGVEIGRWAVRPRRHTVTAGRGGDRDARLDAMSNQCVVTTPGQCVILHVLVRSLNGIYLLVLIQSSSSGHKVSSGNLWSSLGACASMPGT